MKKTRGAVVGIVLAFFILSAASKTKQTADQNTLLPIKEGGLWGFIDMNGKVVISPRYSDIRPFSEGIALVWDDMEGLLYIDRSGNTIWSPPDMFDLDEEELAILMLEHDSFREGLARVKVEGSFGFIDKSGNLAIEPQYLDAMGFSEGLAAVQTPEGWGYIRKDGTLAVKPQFASADVYQDGLAAIERDDKWGFIDKTGKIAIEPKYDIVGRFYGGLARMGQRDPDTGNTLRLFEAISFHGKWGFIDKKDTVAIDVQFSDASDFSEDLAAVAKDDKWGYIDKSGKFVIAPQFEAAELYSDGLAAVKKDGKWGYIDTSGKFAIAPQFHSAYEFRDGMASVWLEAEAKMGYILKTGKYLWGPSK